MLLFLNKQNTTISIPRIISFFKRFSNKTWAREWINFIGILSLEEDRVSSNIIVNLKLIWICICIECWETKHHWVGDREQLVANGEPIWESRLCVCDSCRVLFELDCNVEDWLEGVEQSCQNAVEYLVYLFSDLIKFLCDFIIERL